MLTPQEVSTHAFAKAPFNGYSMTMVDEFLDELTEDYTALYKENAVLKAKMKVMVEKVEEYRATEDSMRAALLTAQRMADSIVKEAEAKRDEMLAQAEADAKAKNEASRREAEEIEARIRTGREDMVRFLAASRDLCARQQEFLDQLPTMEIILEEQEARPVREIQEKVLDAFGSAEEAASGTDDAPETGGDGGTKGDGTGFRLDELKFGRQDREDALT